MAPIKRIRGLLRGDTLSARTIRSTLLTLFSFGGAQFLRLLSNLVLTRILFPEAFGLMALVQVVILGLGMISVTGVKTAIIQNKRGDEPEFLNTAWVVQIGRGIFLWGFTIFLAGPAAAFYEQPILAWMIPAAGFTAVLDGMQSTNMSSAGRHLLLGKLTFIELSSQIVGIVVMIALALITGSVWSLLIGGLIAAAAKAILSHLILPGIRNKFSWDTTAFWEIFHFGKYILVGSIAGFLINTGDRAILGKFVTLADLAVYNIGYFLATVPVMMSHKLGSKVLFPLYARVTDAPGPDSLKKQQLARTYLTGGMLITAIFLAIIGDWLIKSLYSVEYHLGGAIMVLIALAYLPTILVGAYRQRLLAAGNSRDMTIYTVLQATVQTVILLVGIRELGLMGAIIAPPLAVLIIYPMIAFFVRRIGGWEPKLDITFAAICLLGTACALWLNDTAISDVLAASKPQ